MTVNSGQNIDFARANALYKQTYADNIEDLVPESDYFGKEFDFIAAEKQPGNFYNQPVTATREMGATFANDGSLFQLNKPLARAELNAQILGSECVVRTAVSYGALSRALKGDTNTRAGMRAFVNMSKDSQEALVKGASYFRECQMLYGGGPSAATNLGVVRTVASAAGNVLTVTLDPADWATAVWAGSENGEFDFFTAGGVKRNTSGTTSDTVFKLTGVAAATYSLTFASHASNVAAVAVGDQIFFSGSRSTSMLGIVGAALTTGSLWGINTSTYGLWKPQTVDVGGQATFETIMRGTGAVADLGFKGKLNVHVSPATWQDINADQAAMTNHADKRGGEVTLGSEEITFFGQTGAVSIKPNIYIKRGLAVGLPEGECVRVGSTDITYVMPGYGKMFRELEDYAGVEFRVYWDQAFFCKHPSYMVLYTGIRNATD